MKEVVSDVTVPLYDSSKADPSAPINSSAAEMKFGDLYRPYPKGTY